MLGHALLKQSSQLLSVTVKLQSSLCRWSFARSGIRQQQLATAATAVEQLTRNISDLKVEALVLPDLELQASERDWSQQLQRTGLLAGCEPQRAPLRVAVLLSGGVDSSLSLRLLQAAGHHVTAFYLQIWFQEDFENFWGECPWEDDLRVCEEVPPVSFSKRPLVCKQANVPLKVVSLTKQYWDLVVSTAVQQIRLGHTPNPDMLCNSRVKFGAFYDILDEQHPDEFDRVASGHYASLHRSDDDDDAPVQLRLSADSWKDQTYFLASLSQAQLARTMFPIGVLTKAEVRELAATAQLPNRSRPDSQGICFLGKVPFSEFVERHLGKWPGLLIEEETNEIVGAHEGMWFYTPGQRKGIMLSGGPWYVTRKNTSTNAVYLSRHYHEGALQRNCSWCDRFSWIHQSYASARPQQLQCKVRHGPHIYKADLHWSEDGSRARVVLDGNDQGLAAGQYLVFYQDGACLGSAIMCPAPEAVQSVASLRH